jgi:hypothetical protein
MGDPARQEERRVGDVAGICATRAEEVAGMVKRHEHDGQTTQKVDALEALLGFVL